jgi:hypothetical protein
MKRGKSRALGDACTSLANEPPVTLSWQQTNQQSSSCERGRAAYADQQPLSTAQALPTQVYTTHVANVV